MKSHSAKTLIALLIVSAASLSMVGCKDNDSAFEESGEKVDEAIQDTERAIEDAVD